MEAALGRLTRGLAIDLGTANTLVYVEGKGVVLDEPSVVAVRRTPTGGYGDVVAVGIEAQQMLGRTPADIVALRPLREGVIADFQVTEEMLRAFIRRSVSGPGMVKPRVVVCIPFGLTEVEKRAVHESARAAGTREVVLLSEPMAAALGAGLPIMEPTASLVVDIGGGTTEVAIISLGGLVASHSLRVAGDAMNEAVANWVATSLGLQIGERTAEALKLEVGCAAPLVQPLQTVVKGRDSQSGIPRQERITSEDIRGALEQPIRTIIETVRQVLERTPPELAGDVLENGMLLCGGGALLRGLPQRLRAETGLPVHLAEEPLRCVVHGAGAAVEQPELLSRIRIP